MKIQTTKTDLFTEIVLETFKFNGRIIAAGDGLTRDLGLSSALWQVLGAVRETPLTMAQIARNMGLTRQAVRRSANILEKKGLIQFRHNPDHQRAKLVAPTDNGCNALKQLEKIQVNWASSVSKKFRVVDLETLLNMMKALGEEI